MGLADITREAVLQTLAEFDDIGRQAFLSRYRFGRARLYEVVHNGRRYDSKAVAGAAHRHITGYALAPADFSGGEDTVVRQLRGLGFEVVRGTDDSTGPAEPTQLSLRAGLQAVLNLADRFSIDATPEMRARDSATRDCAEAIRSSVGQISQAYGLGNLDLRVEAGGRRANYSPVAWVRIYSTLFSPSATEGFYLVYLFAADGSRVYLSLNQGTSEFRAGKKRPVTNGDVLTARAAEARSEIADLTGDPAGDVADGSTGDQLDGGGHISIDLAWRQLQSVGSESRRRIRNYEDGNVLAYEYTSGQIPTDDRLIGDLARILPALAYLYGTGVRTTPPAPGDADVIDRPAGTGPDAAGIARKVAGRRQGRLQDAAVRKAVEIYAEDVAERFLHDDGWTVTRVGHLKLGYDLDCTHQANGVLHVEVKGTQTLGEEVILTPNEVRHNDPDVCAAQHALFVVAEITVTRAADRIECAGGRFHRRWPWTIEPAALTPTQFAYRVPPAVG